MAKFFTAANGRTVGVDRLANVLRGYVVAQKGPFKMEGKIVMADYTGWGEIRAAGLASRIRFDATELRKLSLRECLGREVEFGLAETTRGAEAVGVRPLRARQQS